jgi:hypothetical protein
MEAGWLKPNNDSFPIITIPDRFAVQRLRIVMKRELVTVFVRFVKSQGHVYRLIAAGRY